MNFKNLLVEQIEDTQIKTEIYHNLYKNIKIGYSVNPRGIPSAIYETINLSFIINPNEYQEAYCSNYIQTIQESIKNLYSDTDIQELKELWSNNHDEFILVIKEDSQQINQYSYESILEYFINLFNIEEEIQQYNFQDSTNEIICINSIMSLLIKGYKVEAEEIPETRQLKIIIQDNNMIEGCLYFTLDKNKSNHKNIKLKNDYMKEILKGELNIDLYGNTTNTIDGYIPFNIILEV